MKTHYPTREASSKTLSRTRVENSLKQRAQTFDSQTNRIARSRMGSGYIQDSIIYKNMKLSTMVENLSSFARCLDDTKWIFDESYRLIRQLLGEWLEFYQDAPSRRIRVDNIAKEYANLKKRFDMIDMGEIRNIVESYMGQHKKTLDSFTIENKSTVPMQQSKGRKSSVLVGHTANTINLVTKTQPRVQESSHFKARISELELRSTQQTKLNEQLGNQLNQQCRRSEQKFRQNQQLRAMILNSRQNELCTINKLKLTLKKLRQMSDSAPDKNLQMQHIDALIINLSAFQQRLRDQMSNISEHQQSIDQLTVKRQMLQGEIRTLRFEIDNLRDEKGNVENYINQLQQKLRSKAPSTNLGPNLGEEYMTYLLLQASAIENFLK